MKLFYYISDGLYIFMFLKTHEVFEFLRNMYVTIATMRIIYREKSAGNLPVELAV